MGILDDLTRLIPEDESRVNESKSQFDLDYNEEDGTYTVNREDSKCCVVEFVDIRTDRTVEIDDAQLDPEYHIAYIKESVEDSDEFEEKLSDMGFDNISVEEEEDLEEAPLKPDFVSDDGRLAYKIVKDREWGEWLARAYLDGKYNEYKTAHESDDPEGRNQVVYAAKAGIKNWNAMDDAAKDRAKEEALAYDREEAENESVEESELTETSNMDVVSSFIADNFAHNEEEAQEMGLPRFSTVWGSTNLKISKQDNGWALINYDTPIMFRDNDGNLYFNTDEYSTTTSKIQNMVKDELGDTKYEEVDEEGIMNVIK